MVHCKLTLFNVGRTFVEFKKTADFAVFACCPTMNKWTIKHNNFEPNHVCLVLLTNIKKIGVDVQIVFVKKKNLDKLLERVVGRTHLNVSETSRALTRLTADRLSTHQQWQWQWLSG